LGLITQHLLRHLSKVNKQTYIKLSVQVVAQSNNYQLPIESLGRIKNLKNLRDGLINKRWIMRKLKTSWLVHPISLKNKVTNHT